LTSASPNSFAPAAFAADLEARKSRAFFRLPAGSLRNASLDASDEKH
jgi:hypothetical protein